MTVKTRFAPSPTGYLHIGGARTALFSWLHAQKNHGKFVLRIEDTDRERSTQEAVDAILAGMDWLGLTYDEGPVYQTDRFDRYREIIQQLLANNQAYYCYCSKERLETMRTKQMASKQKPRYDGRCRDLTEPVEGVEPVVRFSNPQEGFVAIDDLVRGKVVIQNSELDDLIIARSDGTPTYNLTVVVDDMDMGIDWVIRGDDHLSNTPRQINILRALDASPPAYAHVPMILGEDGKRLSKRHGAVSVLQYREEGYLSQALLNYLVRLGWSHGDQEVFSKQEMQDLFDVKNINKAASTFNPEKLLWLNQHYIKTTDPAEVAEHLRYHIEQQGIDASNGPALSEIVVVLRERAKTLQEMAQSCRYFFEDFTRYNEKAAKKNFKETAIAPLQALHEALTQLEDWQPAMIQRTVEQVAETLILTLGKVAQPLRVAVTGGAVSPGIDETVHLIGKTRCVQRIANAVAFIESNVN